MPTFEVMPKDDSLIYDFGHHNWFFICLASNQKVKIKIRFENQEFKNIKVLGANS